MSKILLIQGSPRSFKNCPDQKSKTEYIIEQAVQTLPEDIEIEMLDLAIDDSDKIIRPCKGCVGTAGGYHCHWPCDCYGPGSASAEIYDTMHELDIYSKLEEFDGFVVFSPIHWYSVTTQVKAMFDRLVCANLTLTADKAKELGIGKDSKVSRVFAKERHSTDEWGSQGKYDQFLQNHLEGKVAGFFVHGDNGADDYNGRKLPLAYRKNKISMNHWSNPSHAVMGIVNQCRYSGILIPKDCIEGFYINSGYDYATANDRLRSKGSNVFEVARDLIIRVSNYIKH